MEDGLPENVFGGEVINGLHSVKYDGVMDGSRGTGRANERLMNKEGK